MEPALQRSIDAAARRGGGHVELPPGVVPIGNTILLRSGVHLTGAADGTTVLQPTASNLPNKHVEGAGVYAVLGMVAVRNASVSNLTIDLATHGVVDNGVAILPAGVDYSGTPSREVDVRNVRVLARPTQHSYMIWNLRGERIRILDNTVDGGFAQPDASSNQEGIESYGGRDVLIAGNTVKNVGNACFNIGSAGGADTAPEAIVVSRNIASGCRTGIHVGAALDPVHGAQNPTAIVVIDNRIGNVGASGISVKSNTGTGMAGLLVQGNTVRKVGGLGSGAAGILVEAPPDEATLSSIVLRDNCIVDVRGLHAHGVRVTGEQQVTIANNVLADITHTGIFLVDGPDARIIGNSVADVGYSAIAVHGNTSGTYVRRNTGRGWGHLAAAAAVLRQGAEDGIDENTFVAGQAHGAVVQGQLEGRGDGASADAGGDPCMPVAAADPPPAPTDADLP